MVSSEEVMTDTAPKRREVNYLSSVANRSILKQ